MPTKTTSTAKRSQSTEPRKAAIYCRISSDRTGAEHGVSRQRADCKARAAELGWGVVSVLVDDDVSAYSGKRRPGYEQLLEQIGRGEVDALVVWHPDRLHRSPAELERFIAVVEAHGTQIATVTAGDLDLATASGRMTARIVGAVARHESEHKSERIKRQRDELAQAGRVHGGRRPFGYTADGMSVVDVEAGLIREGIVRVLSGASTRTVALEWNASGSRTAGSRTKPDGYAWTIAAVRAVLTGPRIAGLRQHRGEVIGDALWTAIISRDEHERVRSILGSPLVRKGGRPPTSLLAGGLLRCGAMVERNGKLERCGANLAIGTSRGDRRYVCGSAPGRPGCGGIAITATAAEDAVTAWVLHRIDSPEVGKARKDRARAGKTRPDAGAQLATAEADLSAIADDFGAGRITRAEWMRIRDGIEARIAETRRDIDVNTDTNAVAELRSLPDVAKAWKALDLEGRRTVLRALIDHIDVVPWRRGISPAERLKPVWKV